MTKRKGNHRTYKTARILALQSRQADENHLPTQVYDPVGCKWLKTHTTKVEGYADSTEKRTDG